MWYITISANRYCRYQYTLVVCLSVVIGDSGVDVGDFGVVMGSGVVIGGSGVVVAPGVVLKKHSL